MDGPGLKTAPAGRRFSAGKSRERAAGTNWNVVNEPRIRTILSEGTDQADASEPCRLLKTV